MQLTTREAVEEALNSIEYSYFMCVSAHGKARLVESARLLCDHYGFKLSQFFDAEEA